MHSSENIPVVYFVMKTHSFIDYATASFTKEGEPKSKQTGFGQFMVKRLAVQLILVGCIYMHYVT